MQYVFHDVLSQIKTWRRETVRTFILSCKKRIYIAYILVQHIEMIFLHTRVLVLGSSHSSDREVPGREPRFGAISTSLVLQLWKVGRRTELSSTTGDDGL